MITLAAWFFCIHCVIKFVCGWVKMLNYEPDLGSLGELARELDMKKKRRK